MPERVPASTNGATYTVQAGDSVYQIAQRLAGADRGQTVAVAEQILDLNLGTVMNDGQRFTNAAYIEPGWVLVLAGRRRSARGRLRSRRPHRPRCTSSNMARRCGRSPARSWPPSRWPEIWELNRGDDMVDGAVLVEPDLIMPGWELALPTSNAAGVAGAATAPPIATAADRHGTRTSNRGGVDNATRPATRRRTYRGSDHRRPAGASRAATDGQTARSRCPGGHHQPLGARRRRPPATGR